MEREVGIARARHVLSRRFLRLRHLKHECVTNSGLGFCVTRQTVMKGRKSGGDFRPGLPGIQLGGCSRQLPE
ncbi:MAG TPA: hypothetical protein VMH22_06605 [bacterium]|nr:hypothetical protein [bacterium]